ncbi:MAG: PEGA domain-containing protein [Acidobacteriia bacterium]|nr:PEGA domain-containing protein [Terriglobia bacterium]
MQYARIFALLIVTCGPAMAADKKPASELTSDERQVAYNVAVNGISGRLKAPLTAHFTPIEQAIFSTGRKDSIDVRLNVDAQNSFGAMLREGWWCRVWPQRQVGLYPVSCFAIAGRIPKDAVQGLQPQSGTEPPSEIAATAAQKSDSTLISVSVESSPSDALVEVDGYPAGRTPANVKLAKGEYILKVSKPGFQAWSQRITVEPGKDKSIGITLAPTAKSERPTAQN